MIDKNVRLLIKQQIAASRAIMTLTENKQDLNDSLLFVDVWRSFSETTENLSKAIHKQEMTNG